MMKRSRYSLFLLGLFTVLIFYCPFVFAVQQDPASPVKVVVVSGSNYEMGVQYGEQAAGLIEANRDATWDLLNTKIKYTDQSGEHFLKHDDIIKDIKVWTYYIEKYDPKLVEWLNGISAGCLKKGVKISYVDLVALMVLPQELWARPASPYPAETGVAALAPDKNFFNPVRQRTDTRAVASCTAFAATGSATGNDPMVSLTLGFIPEITQYIILFAYPAEGEPFVSLTMAGKVTNNTGMNSHFAWVMTAAVTHPATPCASTWGVNSEVYHHYLQQYCKSPKEAMEFLDSTPAGGVTGIFLFAGKSGEAFAYEVGACKSAVRKPGDLGEPTDFVATANNYNGGEMKPFAIPAEWFADTYIRYATLYQKLSKAKPGDIGLDFAKACWLSNDWFDAVNNAWKTVPVPNDPDNLETCNVPGNNCEGGESQVIQFPKQKTVYLQPGGPHGTSIKNYWPPKSPSNPKPTGEYTKWQLLKSIDETARAASADTMEMLKKASNSLEQQGKVLDVKGKAELEELLKKAKEAWDRAKKIAAANSGHNQAAFNHQWGLVYTDYATAQLFSQMVSTRLIALSKN